jgi:hypothetical protein
MAWRACTGGGSFPTIAWLPPFEGLDDILEKWWNLLQCLVDVPSERGGGDLLRSKHP